MSERAARGERKWQKPKRNWLLIAVISLGVTGVLYFAARVTVAFVVEHMLPQGPYAGRARVPFTQTAWRAGLSDTTGSRYLMLDDLLAKHPLAGLSRAELVALLGPIQPPGPPTSIARYYLGPENHPFREGNAWLVLTFDATDRVSSVEVRSN